MVFKLKFYSIILLFFINGHNYCEARPDTRIINGDLANDFQFPWHVAISVINGINPIHYTSGSLISQNFVLTAAQFIANADLVQLQMGSINYSTPLLSMESNTFFIHPLYDPTHYRFDIGLIKLPQNVQYNNNQRPIRLPSRSQMDQTFVNIQGLVSGFGITSPDSVYLSETLRFTRMIVITNSVCSVLYDPTIIQSNILCAIGSNFGIQAPCFGDTGSALVINESAGQWTQIGVTVFYSSAGCERGPVGFTRITDSLHWIAQTAGLAIRP